MSKQSEGHKGPWIRQGSPAQLLFLAEAEAGARGRRRGGGRASNSGNATQSEHRPLSHSRFSPSAFVIAVGAAGRCRSRETRDARHRDARSQGHRKPSSKGFEGACGNQPEASTVPPGLGVAERRVWQSAESVPKKKKKGPSWEDRRAMCAPLRSAARLTRLPALRGCRSSNRCLTPQHRRSSTAPHCPPLLRAQRYATVDTVCIVHTPCSLAEFHAVFLCPTLRHSGSEAPKLCTVTRSPGFKAKACTWQRKRLRTLEVRKLKVSDLCMLRGVVGTVPWQELRCLSAPPHFSCYRRGTP